MKISDFQDLYAYTTSTKITLKGVQGWIFVGEGNYASKSIFLPIVGYGYLDSLDRATTQGRYWSSNVGTYSDENNYKYYSHAFILPSDGSVRIVGYWRYEAFPIRALKDSN